MTHVLIASLFNPFLKRLLTFIIQMTTRKEKREKRPRRRCHHAETTSCTS